MTRDPALGMVGTAITLMFGIGMVKYASDSTKDLMKSGRGKGKKTHVAPDFEKGNVPNFDPYFFSKSRPRY